MGFDVVVIDSISDRGFSATGIDNGRESDNFTGIGHTLSSVLDLACGTASGGKAWLTETAFEQLADIRDYTYTRCHGIVTDNGYLSCVKYYRHHYGCSFDDTAIITRFTVQADINVVAPDSALQGDKVPIIVKATNTGVLTADVGVELYDGDTLIGTCAGTSILKSGEWISTEYTNTMPGHDWNLTAKVVSDPPVDVTKNFTIIYAGPAIDLCAGVPCPDRCYGAALWSRRCDAGKCIRDIIKDANAPSCNFEYPSPKFAVGDQLCSDQPDIMHWFPQTIESITDTSYIGTSLSIPMEWDPYMYVCGGRDPITSHKEPCTHGEEKTETCTDGSVVQTYVCIPPDFVATGNTCPTEPTDDTTIYIIIVGALLGLYLYLRK